MVKDIQEDFLRLVGFEEDEMSKYLPEWRKASEKLRLTEDDIKFGVAEWIPAHFDIRLEGVRKGIGSWVREMIDLMKADEYKKKGVKIVYGVFPSSFQYFYALRSTVPGKVFVSVPDAFMAFFLNMLFHKVNPYLEEAERGGISRACRHCSAAKLRYAARRWEILPTPDISWIWGLACDNAPKTEEFIQAYYDPEWRTYCTRVPHDQSMTLGMEEEPEVWRVEYLANEMRESFEAVQKILGVKVPEEKVQEAHDVFRNYSLKLVEMNELLCADPLPVGGVGTQLLWLCTALHFNTGYAYLEKALDITIEELKQRVAKKEGVLPAGAPKLMAWTVPAAVPWVVKMFEDNGVRYQRLNLMRRRLAPQTYDDPYMAVAEAYFRMGSDTGKELAQICEELESYGADGMVFGFYEFDRWLGGHQRLLARMVEEKTGLPTYYIEGHSWEDRDYSLEALRTRIESICEIVKMRKGQ
jgi:hypothetical protein